MMHPAPPDPGENETPDKRDFELLIMAKALSEAESEQPIIVAGHLNNVA